MIEKLVFSCVNCTDTSTEKNIFYVLTERCVIRIIGVLEKNGILFILGEYLVYIMKGVRIIFVSQKCYGKYCPLKRDRHKSR